MSWQKSLLSLTFLFILSNNFSFAQKVKTGKIFFNDDHANTLDVNERNYLKKSVYEVVFITEAFDLILGKYQEGLSKDGAFLINADIVFIDKDKKETNVRIELVNLQSNTVINYVEKKRIPRLKLQYTLRQMLYLLFYAENYDESLDKIINNEIIPISKNEKSQIKSSEGDEKSITKQDSQNPNQEKLGPEKIVEPEEGIERVESELKKRRKPKKNEVKISKFDSPDIDLSVKKNLSPYVPSNLRLKSSMALQFGRDYSKYISSSIIETLTTIERNVFSFGGRFRRGDSFDYMETYASINQVVGENEEKIANGVGIDGEYNFSVYRNIFYIPIFAQYEKISFVDLSKKGEDVVPWNNNVVWLGAGAKLSIFNEGIELSGGVAKSFIGNSDLGVRGESFPIEGDKLYSKVRIKVYEKYGIDFRFEKISLTSNASKDFKANGDLFAVLLNYR